MTSVHYKILLFTLTVGISNASPAWWNPFNWYSSNNTHIDQTIGTFRITSITETDLPLCFQWLQEPHVKIDSFIVPDTFEEFKKSWTTPDPENITAGFIAHFNNQPIGYIAYNQLQGERWREFFCGIDISKVCIIHIFIGNPELTNKGLGTKLLKEFIEYIKSTRPEISIILVDPTLSNQRAIACFENVGFVPVLSEKEVMRHAPENYLKVPFFMQYKGSL